MTKIGISTNDVRYWSYKSSSYTRATTSTLITSGDGILTGIFVANAGAGGQTWKLWDNTAASTTVLINTTTATTGMINLPNVYFQNGLYLTITTTADITVFYK
jgi:hypothetical protein